MKKIRFVIVGSGWRSLFYVRIAQALPEYFEVSALLCRSDEKAERIQREYHVYTTTSIEACLEMKPDFVVVAVNKSAIYEVTRFYLEKGIPVLAETPPATTVEELRALWALQEQKGARLQVAEQYFKYPTYAAKINLLERQLIGEPYNMTLSAVHEYHAISLIRKMLQTGFEKVSIYGQSYAFPIIETETRYEKLYDGHASLKERVKLTLEFSEGKVAFYDFCSVQYRSSIRKNHLNIQGVRGELTNDTFYYLDEQYQPQVESIKVSRDELGKEVMSIQFKDEVIYTPTFGKCGLTEDEVAIATLLQGMQHYIETKEEMYPLADALQDAYLTLLMQQAVREPLTKVESQIQPWMPMGKE